MRATPLPLRSVLFRAKWATAVAGALLLAGCGGAQKSPPGPPPPTQVGVVTVHPEAVPLVHDLVGRLSATRQADVRARVAGVLQKRLYKEGSRVKQGQILFQIDPAPLKAALDAAEASLTQAEAQATNAHITAQRNRDLLPSGLVSRSDLDNAQATERSTAASVQQAKANVEAARINLGYASVRSPIDGRASQQRVTEGALVGQGEATLLTTVEQLDPIYVNFDQAAVALERLRREQATGNITLAGDNKAVVQLKMQDGTPYAHSGTLDFADVSVDPATGSVALRGIVPNPDGQLLPGMYVSVHLTVGTMNNAYLVPQAGLQRDGTGPYVLVVGPENKVQMKRVVTDTSLKTDWIVTSGLASGDRIVVSGVQNARPGSPVTVVANTDAHSAATVASDTAPASR
jgi:membrane fusion protein, multidrug efflux system